MLTAAHAAAVADLVRREDDVGAAKLHAVYAHSDDRASDVPPKLVLPLGLPWAALGTAIGQAFAHAPAHLYTAAVQLNCNRVFRLPGDERHLSE